MKINRFTDVNPTAVIIPREVMEFLNGLSKEEQGKIHPGGVLAIIRSNKIDNLTISQITQKFLTRSK